MPQPQTNATHYHAQLGLANVQLKLVVCYVVMLGSMKGMRIGVAPCCGVRMAIELK